MGLKVSGFARGTRNVVPAVSARVERPSGLSRRDGPVIIECSRPGRSRDRGSSLIYGSPQLPIIAGGLHVFVLSGYGSDMPVSLRNFIFRPGTGVYPATTAVVADSIHSVVYDRGVVNVVNVDDVHVVHRAVVEESSIVPAPALVALAEITETVRDPAIETDVRAPIALMEKKAVAAPTPITRSPEETNLRRLHPHVPGTQ
jgi:hypothetical protein